MGLRARDSSSSAITAILNQTGWRLALLQVPLATRSLSPSRKRPPLQCHLSGGFWYAQGSAGGPADNNKIRVPVSGVTGPETFNLLINQAKKV